jgi:hypothetical protein
LAVELDEFKVSRVDAIYDVLLLADQQHGRRLWGQQLVTDHVVSILLGMHRFLSVTAGGMSRRHTIDVISGRLFEDLDDSLDGPPRVALADKAMHPCTAYSGRRRAMRVLVSVPSDHVSRAGQKSWVPS